MSWATGCYTEGFSDTRIILLLHLSAPFLCTWMSRNSCVNWGWLYHGFFNGHARRHYECLLLCHGQSQSETAQTVAVLKIRLTRRGLLNPKWWTIILYQCKHEGTRDAVVVGMQLQTAREDLSLKNHAVSWKSFWSNPKQIRIYKLEPEGTLPLNPLSVAYVRFWRCSVWITWFWGCVGYVLMALCFFLSSFNFHFN